QEASFAIVAFQMQIVGRVAGPVHAAGVSADATLQRSGRVSARWLKGEVAQIRDVGLSLRLQPFHRTTSRIWATSPFNQRQRRGRIAEVSPSADTPAAWTGPANPTYYLHLERDDGKRSFLAAAARKRKPMLEAEEGDCVRVDIRPNSEEEGLVERLKRRDMSHLMELHNRTPVWNEETQSYVLNFHGRGHSSVG
uniref:Tub domain-containing protein n=1 Tax=Macrostomum lignano TaxID=282301 RepID=A0A1I8FKI1_9PLAT